MKILKEGTISICPDSSILVEGFEVEGTWPDLQLFALARVVRAGLKARHELIDGILNSVEEDSVRTSLLAPPGATETL